jgi:hypothetical protein
MTDFEVGRADVVEADVTEIRRLRQRGVTISVTEPREAIALAFEPGRVTDSVREALSLAIDRVAIRDVLLQKQGEISAALLPRWLSGYSFLFSTERNVARARQLSPAPVALAFAYDRQDAVVRAIAERIAVNASEAGLTLRPATEAVDVRLVRLPVTARDEWMALRDMAAALKAPWPPSASTPYEAEKELLAGFRAIPVVHLPQVWVLSKRVKNWGPLADVWLEQSAP